MAPIPARGTVAVLRYPSVDTWEVPIMFKHASHMWMCGAMVLAAAAFALVTGSAGFLIPAAGCVLMMVVMMQMMSGGQGGGSDHDGP